MPATKTKKKLADNPTKSAHDRSQLFITACFDAEERDSARTLAIIDLDRVKLSQAIKDWQAGGSKGQQPRTQDGCSPEQMNERTKWETTARGIALKNVVSRAQVDCVAGYQLANDEADYYARIQARRSIYPASELNAIRSREGKIAFDAAFKRPQ